MRHTIKVSAVAITTSQPRLLEIHVVCDTPEQGRELAGALEHNSLLELTFDPRPLEPKGT